MRLIEEDGIVLIILIINPAFMASCLAGWGGGFLSWSALLSSSCLFFNAKTAGLRTGPSWIDLDPLVPAGTK